MTAQVEHAVCDGHADADGFVLEVEEVEVYRQLQGEHSGGLTVGAGYEVDGAMLELVDNAATQAEIDTEIPPVDEKVPSKTETATFALG